MVFDQVSNPFHYSGDGNITCMDALRSMLCGSTLPGPVVYWWGCAFKYLWRWPWKNVEQDIDKCIQCLEYMKAELERSQDESSESQTR